MTDVAGAHLTIEDLVVIVENHPARHAHQSDAHDQIVDMLKAIGIYTVRLKPDHAEWVERMAIFEGRYRRLPDYTAEDFIELMVHAGFASDPGGEFDRRRAVETP